MKINNSNSKLTLKETFSINGCIFRFNNGEYRLLYNEKLINERGYIPWSYMSCDLENRDSVVGEHVIEIYPPREDVFCFADFIRPNTEPVWRKTPHIYTLNKIKEELGIPENEHLEIIGYE